MQRYLVTIALLLLPGALALSLSALFLFRVDEFLSIAQVVERQRTLDNVCIYQGGHGDDVPYKIEAYEATKPSVVVIGSSRSMEVRKRFFEKPFYNAGMGQISSMARMEKLTEKLIGIHKPDFVILLPDYWWFHSDNVGRITPFSTNDFAPLPRVQPRFVTVPIVKVRDGRIGFTDFMSAITRSFNSSNLCRIGWQAAMKGSGFAPDGSYYYGEQLTKPALSEEDWQFSGTIDHLSREPQGSGLDMHARFQFARTLQLLQQAGVRFVVALPPSAPTVYGALRSSAYDFSFIEQIEPFLDSLNIPYVQVLDAIAYGSSDCEFIDGRHGGDVTYARILKTIYEEHEWTRGFIDIHEIDTIIERSAGLAMDPDPAVLQEQEADFLQLGCKK